MSFLLEETSQQKGVSQFLMCKTLLYPWCFYKFGLAHTQGLKGFIQFWSDSQAYIKSK